MNPEDISYINLIKRLPSGSRHIAWDLLTLLLEKEFVSDLFDPRKIAEYTETNEKSAEVDQTLPLFPGLERYVYKYGDADQPYPYPILTKIGIRVKEGVDLESAITSCTFHPDFVQWLRGYRTLDEYGGALYVLKKLLGKEKFYCVPVRWNNYKELLEKLSKIGYSFRVDYDSGHCPCCFTEILVE